MMAIDTTLIEPAAGRLDIGSWPRRSARPSATGAMPYVPALDGLRALAVAAVLLYHGDVSWMPGGFLGVEVFFVISGYLITALLLAERQRTGGTAFLQFWARRARRLLPALFALLAAVAGRVAGVAPRRGGPHPGRSGRRRSATSRTGTRSSCGQSYVEALGRPSPLRHLWSLAVEEQFYLVWPVALALLVRVTRGRRTPMVVATLAFAAGVGAARGRPVPRPASTRCAPTTAPTPGPPACCSAPRWPSPRRRGRCAGTSPAWSPAGCCRCSASSAWSASGGCACGPTSSIRSSTAAASCCSTCARSR